MFIKKKLKRIAKKNVFIYKFYNNFRVILFREKRRHVTISSTFCVEGYPSSANTYFQYILNYILPDEIFAHHTHSVASIKEAKQKNLPTIILIRKPEDAVASRVVRFNYDVGEAIEEFILFYNYVYKHLDRFYVISFDEVIKSEFNDLFKFIEINKIKVNRDLIEDAKTYSKKTIEYKEKDEEYVALPSDKKNQKKEEIKKIIRENNNIGSAKNIYETIIKNRNKNILFFSSEVNKKP